MPPTVLCQTAVLVRTCPHASRQCSLWGAGVEKRANVCVGTSALQGRQVVPFALYSVSTGAGCFYREIWNHLVNVKAHGSATLLVPNIVRAKSATEYALDLRGLCASTNQLPHDLLLRVRHYTQKSKSASQWRRQAMTPYHYEAGFNLCTLRSKYRKKYLAITQNIF